MTSVSLGMTNYPLRGVVRSRDLFLKFWAPVLGIGETKHSKFRVLIDTKEQPTGACVIDYHRKGCVRGHATSLNFGKYK